MAPAQLVLSTQDFFTLLIKDKSASSTSSLCIYGARALQLGWAGRSRMKLWGQSRRWHSQDKLGAVVSPPQDEVLLPPLHKVGQDIPGPPVCADDVLVLPDLQPDQHDADVQHNVHLGRQEEEYLLMSSDKNKTWCYRFYCRHPSFLCGFDFFSTASKQLEPLDCIFP